MKKPLIITTALLATASISFASYNVGLHNGNESGNRIGFENGYNEGLSKGTTQGYEHGFLRGKHEAKTTIPDGYIKLTECIPLQDISCTWTNEYDYLCVEIGDYGKQLDNPSNATYESILADIPNVTEKYRNNMVNMSEVVDYDATESSLYLYMEDGSGYYWEK